MTENAEIMVVPADQSMSRPQSAATVVAMTQRVREILDAVMKENIHYGKIPGTQKPSLYQPGAEKLCLTFGLTPTYDVEDLSTPDAVKFRVTCTLRSRTSGEIVAQGIGEASSDEEKYKWRRATCAEEFEEAPPNLRRQKIRTKDGKLSYREKQIRTEPADVANTVLQMSRKRGFVNATRTAVAASDVFDQDTEDLAALGIELDRDQRPPVEQPKATPPPAAPARATAPPAASAPPVQEEPEEQAFVESAIPQTEWDTARSKMHNKSRASEKMVARLMAIARKSGWSPEDVQAELEAQLGVHLSALPGFEFYDAVVSIFERNRKP